MIKAKDIKKISSENKPQLSHFNRYSAIAFYKQIRELLFIEYYHEEVNEELIEKLLDEAKVNYNEFARPFDIDKKYTFDNFIDENFKTLKKDIFDDVKAIYEGDPACQSYEEIILAYPGFVAISAYRIAHILYEYGLKFVARIISEYAHSRTGIDINPGAKIGHHFFIDHGTGIVIGETCIIGNNVKIYQGVTLGALSLKEGHDLYGTKRHPTIENNVTIYCGACIFGGETVIGENSIIGSNSYIVSSVPKDSIVKISPCDIQIIKKN